MIFRKLTFAAAASCFALALSSPVSAETVETPAAPGPALWKLADEDTTIYLFGTVHILPKDKVWFGPVIDQALDSSDVLVTEIPSGPETDAKAAALIAEKGTLPAGTTVRSLLDPEQLATYEAAMSKLGIPAESFDSFEPWMGALNFSLLPSMMAGYSPEVGVETVLEREAAPTVGRGALETLEFQFSVFDELPMEKQVTYMITAAEMVDEMAPFLDSMVAEWIAGDAEGLAELMNEGMDDDPVIAERLLFSRNANWAEWIDQRMDQPGTVFIAVGAGHLAGERSVQDLLEQRGFTIDRVQ
ncbi:TraB/GumN family protein [Parerythrobacter aurantius]|uniref:TraB/GumN family protein n=1 Tax=Parerythrobacter aurantius TaxID=3127706 RepID=UPI00324EBF50